MLLTAEHTLTACIQAAGAAPGGPARAGRRPPALPAGPRRRSFRPGRRGSPLRQGSSTTTHRKKKVLGSVWNLFPRTTGVCHSTNLAWSLGQWSPRGSAPRRAARPRLPARRARSARQLQQPPRRAERAAAAPYFLVPVRQRWVVFSRKFLTDSFA